MAGSVSVDHNNTSQSPSSAIFFSLLVPALILWYIYWRLSRRRLYALAEKLPGPEGLPIIGNALDLTGTSHSKLINQSNHYYKSSHHRKCDQLEEITSEINVCLYQIKLISLSNVSLLFCFSPLLMPQFFNSTQLRLLKFFTSRTLISFFIHVFFRALLQFLLVRCVCSCCTYST